MTPDETKETERVFVYRTPDNMRELAELTFLSAETRHQWDMTAEICRRLDAILEHLRRSGPRWGVPPD